VGEALEPCRLAPVASINRVRLGGTSARDLLSAAALAELASAAGLRPDGPVRSFLDGCLGDPDPWVRRVAAEVADRFAERLGLLLATLRSGDRTARPEWDDSYWERWAATSTVWLGGGLAAGPFGALVAERAAGSAGCRVVVAPGAEDLPLVGAARAAGGAAGSAGGAAGTAGGAAGSALTLDFGHSWVKRAVADYDGGQLVSLRLLAPVPAPEAAAAGVALAEQVADTVAEAWAEAGGPGPLVIAAMAAYVRDGQPVRTQLGTYTRLAEVSDDVPGWLSTRAGVRVVLVHDGTAAAHALPADPHSVVVLLGTTLGVGYPHPCPGLATVRTGGAA